MSQLSGEKGREREREGGIGREGGREFCPGGIIRGYLTRTTTPLCAIMRIVG